MGSTVSIRILESRDAQVLSSVAPGVFDREIDPDLTTEFLSDPRHHLAVALLEGEVIGMASALHYVHPDKPAEMWVNEVGVAPSHRNRGLGRRLLQALFERGRSLGCREAWLATDTGNVAARRLCNSLGGKEEPAVLVTFDLEQGP